MTSQQLLEQWTIWQYAARRAQRTVQERIGVIGRFLAETGIDPLASTPMDVAGWMAGHHEWGPSTAATYHSYLQSWHKWLCLMDYRTTNPMLKLPAPRRPERSPRPVADADLLALINSRMHQRTRVMILLGALAGLRVSEIAAVAGEDISEGRIYIRGKGGKQAWVPLHPLLIEIAQSMPKRGWWFPGNSRRPGEHVLPKGVSDIIGMAMRRAGVPGTPHALRHWYGTNLLAAGADLRTVQELMRHSSIQTTQVYTRVPDERRVAAVGRLDPFLAA